MYSTGGLDPSGSKSVNPGLCSRHVFDDCEDAFVFFKRKPNKNILIEFGILDSIFTRNLPEFVH